MDPILVMIIGGAALFATLGCALAALVIAVGFRRRPWRSGGMAAASALVFLASTAMLPARYDAAEHDGIKDVHAGFAPALERYRQAHGEYPPTLEAAGIATPQTRYGPLRYRSGRAEDGAAFYSVGFGDWWGNGFDAYFDSRKGTWQIDS
ncbi:MAG TPA: hypothetical protein VHG08_04400 [Longimicrobium sp.]|nr:hypothetical protein [Longimicrobium sp.]